MSHFDTAQRQRVNGCQERSRSANIHPSRLLKSMIFTNDFKKLYLEEAAVVEVVVLASPVEAEAAYSCS